MLDFYPVEGIQRHLSYLLQEHQANDHLESKELCQWLVLCHVGLKVGVKAEDGHDGSADGYNLDDVKLRTGQ